MPLANFLNIGHGTSQVCAQGIIQIGTWYIGDAEIAKSFTVGKTIKEAGVTKHALQVDVGPYRSLARDWDKDQISKES